MKLAIFTVILIGALLTGGCQDNSITEPPGTMLSATVPVARNLPMNSIVLNTVLHEPGIAFNSFVEVTGQIQYSTKVVHLDPVPPNPQSVLVVEMKVQADLKPFEAYGPVWGVFASSEDWVPLAEETDQTASLTKKFAIEGRSDGVTLNMHFQITDNSVVMDRMWLEVPRGVASAANNE